MNTLNNEQLNTLKEKIISFSYNNQFNAHIGYEFIELDEKHGISKMKVMDHLLNPYGSVHGGVILSLADSTVGTTACMCGYYVTTLSCNLNFMLPAINTEYLYCEATLLRGGKHIMVFDVKIKDDNGNLLDSGEYSYFVTPKAILEE